MIYKIGTINMGPNFHLKPVLTQSLSSSSGESELEELQLIEDAPPFWRSPARGKKRLSKQLSMCETPRDVAWERRRRQMLHQERKKNGIQNVAETEDLTDEDLNELKGSIELGFGFNEEHGQRLCGTLPALDLYFAVNRQFATSPALSPNTPHSNSSSSLGSSSLTSLGDSSDSLGERSSSLGSDTDSWKILSPGLAFLLPIFLTYKDFLSKSL